MKTEWTSTEIQILKDNFSDTLSENLEALLPPHTLSGIRSKANKLGLTKSKEYRKDYLAINRINAIEALKGNIPWNKQESIHKICETCGKAFEVPGYRKDTARYCNRKCVDKWLTTTQGETHWHYRLIERTCQWCGKSFKGKPSEAAKGKGVYCSRSCVGSALTQSQGGKRSSIEFAIEQVLIILNEPFESQKQMGHWIVDFYLPNRNLIIECDGKYWHNLPEVVKRDQRKDHWIHENGYKILRLKEDDINTDPMEAMQQGLYHSNTPFIKDL